MIILFPLPDAHFPRLPCNEEVRWPILANETWREIYWSFWISVSIFFKWGGGIKDQCCLALLFCLFAFLSRESHFFSSKEILHGMLIFNKQSTITLIERELGECGNSSVVLKLMKQHLESHWVGASLHPVVDMHNFICVYFWILILVQHSEFPLGTICLHLWV